MPTTARTAKPDRPAARARVVVEDDDDDDDDDEEDEEEEEDEGWLPLGLLLADSVWDEVLPQ